MKWEYRDRFSDYLTYDEIVTTYEAEDENSPLKITKTGYLKQGEAEFRREKTEQISLCWIYKGYHISNTKAHVTDERGQKRFWELVYCVREVPTENRNTCKDRHFLTLEEAVKFIDEQIPKIEEATQILQEMHGEEKIEIPCM